MRIVEVSWKNFNSYGNSVSRVDFEKDSGDLYLLIGGNGNGKCLSPDTLIEIDIEDPIIKEEFLSFLKNKRSNTLSDSVVTEYIK